MDPVLYPTQTKSIFVSLAEMEELGWEMVAEVLAAQLLKSVTETLYVPEFNPPISCVLEVFDHVYAYGGDPPRTDKLINPFEPEKQDTFCCVVESDKGA